MPTCVAFSARSKRQCRNQAMPGSNFCEVPSHQAQGASDPGEGARAAQPFEADPPPPAPAPAPAPVLESAPPPPSDDPWAGLESLPMAAGPEAEPAAQAPEARELHAPELEPGADPASWVSELPEPAQLMAGRWTPEKTRRLVVPAVNAIFSRSGKEKLTPGEEEYTAEVFAAIADDWLSRVDPNSKWGALSLWCLTVPLPRYLADIITAARSRPKPVAAPVESSAPVEAAPAGPGAFSW